MQRLLREIPTFALVLIIALVVWLLAEGRTVQTHEVSLDVQLISPPGQSLIIEPEIIRSLRVRIRSANSQLALVEEVLREGPLPVEVANDPSRLQTINLVSLLASHRQFADLGVEVDGVTPAEKLVRVEDYVTVSMPVRVVTGLRELSATPTVEPAQVNVTVPASTAELLANRRLEVHLDQSAADGSAADVDRTVELPVQLPEDLEGVQAFDSAPRVRVTYRLRSLSKRVVIDRVPVLMLAPPAQTHGVRVELDDAQRVLREVALSGQTRVIDQIEAGEIEVWAYFRMTATNLTVPDDEDSITVATPLLIEVPTGVVVESPPPVVTVRVSRLEAGSAQ